MFPLRPDVRLGRRGFLGGVAGLALASLLKSDGLLAEEPSEDDPLRARTPHFPARARNCICFFMSGGPSQLDLFCHKPKLNEWQGQLLPPSLQEGVELAFSEKETARIMPTPFLFAKYGQSGLEFSELLPHLAQRADDLAFVHSLHTESFNHLPAQVMMNTGFILPGRPTMGSWLVYGLGSESQSLPAYVVLSNGADNGSVNWSSGFLPSTYQGVALRNQGAPIPHLDNPPGLTSRAHRRSLDVAATLNRANYQRVADEEILSRIASYELAFRMQAAAPELIDLGSETQATLEAYGVSRADAAQRSFSTHCLLARRLVERGVRFVNVYYGDWDAHFGLINNHKRNCAVVDQPLGALLADLKARGLLDSTLVMWISEFGRTPIGENRSQRSQVTGRDHHPTAFTVWLAGGGIRGGQAIGQTDEIGWKVVEDGVHVHDFHATLLHLFGFDHTRLTYRYQGRDFRLTDISGSVVEQLLA